jgi:hypothetical protein
LPAEIKSQKTHTVERKKTTRAEREGERYGDMDTAEIEGEVQHVERRNRADGGSEKKRHTEMAFSARPPYIHTHNHIHAHMHITRASAVKKGHGTEPRACCCLTSSFSSSFFVFFRRFAAGLSFSCCAGGDEQAHVQPCRWNWSERSTIPRGVSGTFQCVRDVLCLPCLSDCDAQRIQSRSIHICVCLIYA